MIKPSHRLVLAATLLSLIGSGALAAPRGNNPRPDRDPPIPRPPVFACQNTVCGVSVVYEHTNAEPGQELLVAVAHCPFGKHAIGGGTTVSGDFHEVAMFMNEPYMPTDDNGDPIDPLPLGWRGGGIMVEDNPETTSPFTVHTWAICATIQ